MSNILVDTGYVQIRRYSVGYQVRYRHFKCMNFGHWLGLHGEVQMAERILEAAEQLKEARSISTN